MAEPTNGRIRLSWGQIVTFIGWITTVLLAYGAIDARLSVVEDRYERLFRDVGEIKADVKVLIQRAQP